MDTSVSPWLEARASLGQGGAIEACIQLLIDGPDKVRLSADPRGCRLTPD